MENMKKYARIIDIVVQAAFWLLLVTDLLTIGIGTGSLIGNLFGGNFDWLQRVSVTMDFGGMTYGYSFLAQRAPAIPFVLVLIGALSIGGMVLMLYALRKIHAAMQYLKEGYPFDPAVSGTFLKMGKLSIIYGIVVNTVQLLAAGIIWKISSDLMAYAADFDGGSLSFDFHIDFTFILIGIICLLFGYIFKYGETLQKEVDETL